MNIGATLGPEGTKYRLWAPKAHQVRVEIESATGRRTLNLDSEGGGYFSGIDVSGAAGDSYGFSIGGDAVFPDPAARAQRDSVHGKSLVVDPRGFPWTDQNWRRPPFRDLVIYELHIGAFTPQGTFRSAIERLSYLRELGVTAIEIMPIADFPGGRNWGYDGVLIYAPAQAYGTPDDLRALVDAAHREGLAVLLDVVYNHFGPDGNYLGAYGSEYFCKRHHTPWGDGFNFDDKGNGPVREFFLGNPPYWMEEFHVDGFRFDATHEIQDDSPVHILKEMVSAVHARGGYAIAEDFRNDVKVLRKDGLGFDGVWADDFHHSMRVSQTHEKHAYLQDFQGTIGEVVECLEHGWLYRGQTSRFLGRARGTKGKELPPSAFVHCLSNHDQTGNRALGERIGTLIQPAAYRTLSTVLCLTPYTPMLFMGQEWGTASPFLFFCDHNEKLGKAITEGRRREFACFPEFSDPDRMAQIPDPQAEETFLRSKLEWQEADAPGHEQLLALYRKCLGLRFKDSVFRPEGRQGWEAKTDGDIGVLRYWNDQVEYQMLFCLQPEGKGKRPDGRFELVFSSEDACFGGSGGSAWATDGELLVFPVQEAFLLRKV